MCCRWWDKMCTLLDSWSASSFAALDATLSARSLPLRHSTVLMPPPPPPPSPPLTLQSMQRNTNAEAAQRLILGSQWNHQQGNKQLDARTNTLSTSFQKKQNKRKRNDARVQRKKRKEAILGGNHETIHECKKERSNSGKHSNLHCTVCAAILRSFPHPSSLAADGRVI